MIVINMKNTIPHRRSSRTTVLDVHPLLFGCVSPNRYCVRPARMHHMTDLETMPQVDFDTITDSDSETSEPTSAHIVKAGPGENGAAIVLEARVMGTPIEALCGFVWVPSKDPKQLPVCQKCKDVYEMYKSFSNNVNRDTPID